MHCYEYLVMHLILKCELKQRYPDHRWNDYEVGEVLNDLGANNVQELEQLKHDISLDLRM